MVVKARRLSPSLLDSPVSMTTTNSSTSTDGNDRFLPLFSEQSPPPQPQQPTQQQSLQPPPVPPMLLPQQQQQHTSNNTTRRRGSLSNSGPSIRLGIPSRRGLICDDDEEDDDSDDHSISTCSASGERHHVPQHTRPTSILVKSSASSVASEPARYRRRRHPKGTRAAIALRMSSNDDSITFHPSACVPPDQLLSPLQRHLSAGDALQHHNTHNLHPHRTASYPQRTSNHPSFQHQQQQQHLPPVPPFSSSRTLPPPSSSSIASSIHKASIDPHKASPPLPQQHLLHGGVRGIPALPTRNTFVFTARRRKSPLYLVVAAFCVLGMVLYSQSHATLHDSLQQVLRLTEERRKVHDRFHHLEADLRTLRAGIAELTPPAKNLLAAADPPRKPSALDELAAVAGIPVPRGLSAARREEQRLEGLQNRIEEDHSRIRNLQKHLQLLSKRDAAAKYGSGIIRVELELDFPDEAEPASPDTTNSNFKSSANVDKGDASVLILEMAPLDLMPHSVYMFLEMVNAQLFDGCSFILNALHVIKAAPLPYDGTSAAQKVKSFTRVGLESVAFREYHQGYPHEKHTVAFAADGSPSFYINTQDNSDVHIGEPCFGKVVAGFDTLQRLEEAPTRNGIWYKHRIGIKRARIL